VSATAARTSCGSLRRRLADDRGAAVTEFVMVSVLLLFLVFAVLQVALLFYVRNIVAASAADGARYAASSDVDAADGGVRASGEVRRSLSGSVAASVPCTGTLGTDSNSGLHTTVVRCQGNIKSVFLPLGAFVHITVTARSLTEPAS
jgi:Flp pilus assembly protein TadG